MNSKLKDFLDGRIVVNCKTEKEANKLLDYLHKKNIVWTDGKDLKDTNEFHDYLQNTCYRLFSFNTVAYSDCNYYKKEGYKIYQFSELEIDKEIKEKINIYEKIKVKEKELEELKKQANNEKIHIGDYIEKETRNTSWNLVSNIMDINLRNNKKENRKKISYYRQGESIICEIRDELNSIIGEGVAKCHHEDDFNYKTGMALSEVRARENMYSRLIKKIIK